MRAGQSCGRSKSWVQVGTTYYSLNDYSKLAKTVATSALTLLHSLGSPAWLLSDVPSFGWLTARLSMSPGLLSII